MSGPKLDTSRAPGMIAWRRQSVRAWHFLAIVNAANVAVMLVIFADWRSRWNIVPLLVAGYSAWASGDSMSKRKRHLDDIAAIEDGSYWQRGRDEP